MLLPWGFEPRPLPAAWINYREKALIQHNPLIIPYNVLERECERESERERKRERVRARQKKR